MDRTRFYTTEIVNDTEELDWMHNNVSAFTMKYAVSYYRVEKSDLMRPDLISYKSYGTVNYWWIILYVNGIEDPLTTIEVGQLLQIPNLIDIYDFFKKYKVK